MQTRTIFVHTQTHGNFHSFNVKWHLFYIFGQHYANNGYHITKICDQVLDTIFALNYHLSFCLLFLFHALCFHCYDMNMIFLSFERGSEQFVNGFFLVYLKKKRTEEGTIWTHIFLNLKPTNSPTRLMYSSIFIVSVWIEHNRMRIVYIT